AAARAAGRRRASARPGLRLSRFDAGASAAGQEADRRQHPEKTRISSRVHNLSPGKNRIIALFDRVAIVSRCLDPAARYHPMCEIGARYPPRITSCLCGFLTPLVEAGGLK